MDELLYEISEVLGEEFVSELKNDPFFKFFKSNHHYIYKSHISQAILCFNTALNYLDFEPDSSKRERHILSGDYLFSKFYSILASYNEYQVLNDISQLSTSLISRKSKVAANGEKLSCTDLEYLMFSPLLYLVDNGYAHSDLTSIIKEYLNHSNCESMPY
jgi:hypothetical protein